MANINAKGLRLAIKQQFLASRRRWLSAMDAAWFDIAKGIVKHLTSIGDPTLFLRSDGEWVAPVSSGSGETNTASNQGVGGVGVFDVKVGVDLQFRNINAGSNKVSVVLDPLEKEIEIDVVPSNFTGIPESAVTGLTSDLATNAASAATAAADAAAAAVAAAASVQPSRLISTTSPLGGGGALSSDLTLTIADFVASGASHARGAVPDPGASAGTTKFLCENASWSVPPGLVPAQYPRNFFLPFGSGTSLFTPGNTLTYAFYYGKAGKVLHTVSLFYNVTAVGTGTSYCEIGLAKGVPTVGGGVSLTRLGYVDVTTNVKSPAATGLKTSTLTLTTDTVPDDHIWMMWSFNWATTACSFISQSATDPLQQYVARATTQLSTMASNTAFAANNTLPPLCVLYDY